MAKPAFEHPVAMGSFSSWVRLALTSGGIDRQYVRRFLAVACTTLATSPLRLYESARYGRRIRRTAIHPSPVFILGHWRTGTTLLHNLLCEDRQFGYISTFQAMAPGFCLIGERYLKPMLARAASDRTREIDNMPLLLDGPQEEAFALANMTPRASLHVWALPRRAPEIFAKYVLMEGLSPRERAEWTESYLTLLRKTTLRASGRRLVLKDPCSTGRIPMLLELFPEAKFIHIYRDPYRVFPSTLKVHKIVLATMQLQAATDEEVEELVLRSYERLMRKYLAEKSLIPPGNLVEVRYEDLEAAPLAELGRIYEGLGLPGFAEAQPAFRSHLELVRDFQKNVYRVDDAVIDRVNQRWQFALEAWKYPRLEPRSTVARAV